MFSPEFEALSREAGIAAACIAQGVEGINKAHYAHKPFYHFAFFNFSTAVERLGKLVFVLDHLLEKGAYPTDQDLRSLGHVLVALVEKVEEVRLRRQLKSEPLPRDPISVGIVETLSSFATSTRYYNLDYLVGGRSAALTEPLAAWRTRVTGPIVALHYPAARRAQDEARAAAIGTLMDQVSMVMHTAEDGSPITSWSAGAMETAKIPTIQKYSRMYCLRIIRSLTDTLGELEHLANKKGGELPHFGDFFGIYRNDDAYFLRRKTWDPFNP